MAKQSALIGDLSKQDKVVTTSIMRLEQRIDRVRDTTVNLKGTSSMPQDSPKPMPGDHLAAPIYTIAPPTMHVYDTTRVPNLHPFMVEGAFKGSVGGNKEATSGENAPNTTKVCFQLPGIDTVMELPLYDGTKDPYVHVGTYLSQVENMTLDDELKRKLFVKTLRGSALIWYIEQDTSKCTSWRDLALAFIDRYKSYDNHHALVKRKNVIEPISEEVLGDNSIEAHNAKKGKAIVTKTPNTSPISLNSQTIIPLHESPAILFEKLKSIGMLQPQRGEIFTPLPPHFDSTKHCAFHSNIPGHNTDECTDLRKEIQSLVEGGKIVEVPKGKPQLMWCQPLTFMPTTKVCSQSLDPIPYQKPTNTTASSSHDVPHKLTYIGGLSASLYERLKDAGMVQPIERKLCKKPWKVDPKRSCAYHSGMLGHDIEECFAFNWKVGDLIKSGQVRIDNANDKAIANDRVENAAV